MILFILEHLVNPVKLASESCVPNCLHCAFAAASFGTVDDM